MVVDKTFAFYHGNITMQVYNHSLMLLKKFKFKLIFLLMLSMWTTIHEFQKNNLTKENLSSSRLS